MLLNDMETENDIFDHYKLPYYGNFRPLKNRKFQAKILLTGMSENYQLVPVFFVAQKNNVAE
eukprot:TRINITY_DN7160_c0_g1_i1.p1 TRINITY_DN7160_c0_g1~~TRINITY_DN7160_c0_g1_i1.p1  ORF type:complete len:62 (-),score=5.01 TRINITY_DN7160_c0_g1_i1:95-280(-)